MATKIKILRQENGPIVKKHGQIMTTFSESSKLVVDAIQIFGDIIS